MDAVGIMNLRENDTAITFSYKMSSCVLGY